jgi:putative FmdB family regulatory protein
MPIYEYACAHCETEFERYLRTWGESVTCPACGEADVLKKLSSFAVKGASSGGGGGGCACGRGGCGCHG